MARTRSADIPAAPRKSLLEWIASDDRDTPGLAPPACSPQTSRLHATIVAESQGAQGTGTEPLAPPPGMRLAPLG